MYCDAIRWTTFIELLKSEVIMVRATFGSGHWIFRVRRIDIYIYIIPPDICFINSCLFRPEHSVYFTAKIQYSSVLHLFLSCATIMYVNGKCHFYFPMLCTYLLWIRCKQVLWASQQFDFVKCRVVLFFFLDLIFQLKQSWSSLEAVFASFPSSQ